MPDVEHATVTADSKKHEPKGAATATSGQSYIYDGAGSGAAVHAGPNLNVRITDISTAGSVWVVCPVAGDIKKIYTVIDGAISGADCGITAEIAGTLVTSSAITIANSGSAAGDVDSSTPSAANTVTAGQAIEIITDGASTGTVSANVTLIIDAG